MRFPWIRETRQDTDYGDALLTAIFNQAQGNSAPIKARIGAVAAAAGWWSRAFASAKLTPGPVADAFGPALRGYTGRQLILRGEVVFIIDGAGGLSLTPASTWDIVGGPEPSTWTYKTTVNGPSQSVALEVPASRILHLMYQRSESQPWRGVGPLEDCQETHNLAMALETRLRQEVGGPVGIVVPMPDTGPKSGLEADVNTMRGEVRLTPSTSNNWQGGQQGAPRTDWRSLRIGAEPPEVLSRLRSDAARDILSACGVPGGLVGQTDGTTLREQLRQFLHIGVNPVAGELADTIAATFDLDTFDFDFSPLMASDLSGRARAFGQLVKGGMDIEKAARLTNLLELADDD